MLKSYTYNATIINNINTTYFGNFNYSSQSKMIYIFGRKSSNNNIRLCQLINHMFQVIEKFDIQTEKTKNYCSTFLALTLQVVRWAFNIL